MSYPVVAYSLLNDFPNSCARAAGHDIHNDDILNQDLVPIEIYMDCDDYDRLYRSPTYQLLARKKSKMTYGRLTIREAEEDSSSDSEDYSSDSEDSEDYSSDSSDSSDSEDYSSDSDDYSSDSE